MNSGCRSLVKPVGFWRTSTSSCMILLAILLLFPINLTYGGDDGTVKWQYRMYWSDFSAPAIGANGALFLTDGYKLLAFNPDSSIIWSKPLYTSLPKTPCLGDDGSIYAGPDVNGNLYAYKANGDLKWTYQIVGGNNASFPGPAVGRGGEIIAVTNNGKVYALNQDGQFDLGAANRWLQIKYSSHRT
jgi:outer membrane protein assembly factor BamB